MNSAEALQTFSASVGKSLSTAPAGETRAERRVRLLEDTIRRCYMFDEAKMRLQTKDGRVRVGWDLLPRLEASLREAKRDLKFSRGDY
jgi:hypothetical protein